MALNPVGSNIKTYNNIWGLQLKSFFLGCGALTPNGYAPQDCDLTLVARNPTLDAYPDLVSKKFSYKKGAKMMRFSTDLVAQELYFALTAGSAKSFWYVDNMVVVIYNPKCLM